MIDGSGGATSESSIDCEEHARASPDGRRREQAPALHMTPMREVDRVRGAEARL